MKEYFGTLSMLVVDKTDVYDGKIDVPVIKHNTLFYDIMHQLKNKIKWDNYEIILFDFGNGVLMPMKDNTSKLSVPNFQIQG